MIDPEEARQEMEENYKASKEAEELPRWEEWKAFAHRMAEKAWEGETQFVKCDTHKDSFTYAYYHGVLSGVLEMAKALADRK